jgi:hypothetical protein
MFAARVAKLGELQPACSGLLVLGRRIVPVLALRTLQGNDLAHDTSSLMWPATSAGKQLVLQLEPFKLRHLTRRNAGLMGPCCPIPEFLKRDSQAVRHTLVLIYYPRKPVNAEAQSQTLSASCLFDVRPQDLVHTRLPPSSRAPKRLHDIWRQPDRNRHLLRCLLLPSLAARQCLLKPLGQFAKRHRFRKRSARPLRILSCRRRFTGSLHNDLVHLWSPS